MKLNENERIEMEIKHSKKLPFRLADWLRSLIFIGIIIAAIASIRSEGFISIGSVFLLVTFFLGILPLYFRWKRLQPLNYLITNHRLIIFNESKNSIEYSFDFRDFPEMTLHENAYNSGYIVIGTIQSTFETHGLFQTKVGVNLQDHEIVLENIPEVRKVFNTLKEKIEIAKKSNTQKFKP